MCLNVIKVSVYLQNWSHVVSYVNKAMATPDFAEGETTNDLAASFHSIAFLLFSQARRERTSPC